MPDQPRYYGSVTIPRPSWAGGEIGQPCEPMPQPGAFPQYISDALDALIEDMKTWGTRYRPCRHSFRQMLRRSRRMAHG